MNELEYYQTVLQELEMEENEQYRKPKEAARPVSAESNKQATKANRRANQGGER